MRQKLYLECYAGISGDMTVAALLDLGADEKRLRDTLATLDVDGYTVSVGRVQKGGLDVCDFDVRCEEGHVHRGLPEILPILEHSDMTPAAQAMARHIFEILARAEGKAHGLPPEQVHFHEVGAVDSIVDIAATAICLDDLGITEAIVPVLWEGCGTVSCAHGELPVPVPATLNIAQAYGLSMHRMDVEGEFVTPTGAAIAAALATGESLPARYRVDRVGLGGGKREYARPNILRALLITPEEETDEEGVWKLECNVDDCTGEALGYTLERLMEAGARDAHFTPVFMKKNRPGYLLTVLAAPEDRERMEEILFSETTTIGIRRVWMERSVLPRAERTVATSLGEVRMKEISRGGAIECVPEYESVAAIARASGRPFDEVRAQILAEIHPR